MMGQAPVAEVPETHPASRVYRVFTGLFVFGPPALLAASFRRRWFLATPTNRRIFAVSYLLSGFGITAGYHRLFTHRSFKTYPLIRGMFAVLGSTAIQGSVPDWVADHRKHHAYADEAGDPHSPHVGHKGGPIRGFVHSHFGWLFADEKASRHRYVPDLLDDPVVMAVHRRFALIVVLSYFVAPFTAGLIATQEASWWARSLPVGWRNASVLRAPRHLERQLGLPPLGQAPVRNPGSESKQSARRTCRTWRRQSSQPSRLSKVGEARLGALAVRSNVVAHLDDGEDGPGVGRAARHPGGDGAQASSRASRGLVSARIAGGNDP